MAIKFECPACGKRLNAPDNATGKTAKCPACTMSVTVPAPKQEERIYEAEEVVEGNSTVDDDWEVKDEPDTDDFKLPKPKRSSRGRSRDVESEEEEELARKPCPMCGEMVLASAKICRFCGESTSGVRRQKKRRQVSDEDSELHFLEGLACVFCGAVACTMGVIYMIQGKPKGLKMIGMTIAAFIAWQVMWMVIALIVN